MIKIILLIAAAVCFGLATFNVPIKGINLIGAGLCLLTISFLV